MHTPVYMDNAATTPICPEAADAMRPYLKAYFGNPSGVYDLSVQSRRAIEQARAAIAQTLSVPDETIYFTAGGTESDNWALIGTALANQRAGRHIVTTRIEHPAVSAPIQFLERQGFSVTWLDVDENGRVSPEELEAAVGPETILVSVMYVNNEIGAVEPVEEIGGRIKRKNPNTYFHVDAIQAYGKYRIRPGKMNIDLLSASGHKIHGPKGTGFLYVGQKVKLFPYIYGGGQQQGMRSGTDNVPGAAGLGEAARLAYENLEETVARMRELKNYFVEELRGLDQVTIHGLTGEDSAPHIVSASFAGVRSEVLLHTLEDRGIYVSAGSACSTHKRNQSPTLTAIGLPAPLRESAVRFSFSDETSREELDYTLTVLREVLPMLRRYARK